MKWHFSVSPKVTEIYYRKTYFPGQSRIRQLYSATLFKRAKEKHDLQ